MSDVEKMANLAGAMICVPVARKTAEQLAVIGGEPPERMHLTLAYLGTAEMLPVDSEDKILELVAKVADRHPKLKAQFSGIGRFENTQNYEDAVVALVDAPGLEDLRVDLVKELEKAGFPVSRTHGFTPHVTIAYIGFHEQLPVDRIGGLDMRIGSIEYVQGDHRIGRSILRGKVEKSAATSSDIADAGKLHPLQGGLDEDSDVDETAISKGATYDIKIQFPIAKSDGEQRLVTGIVLEPDEIDTQNDTIDAEGILKTAHNFLSKYNRESEMGHMHRRLGDIGVDLVESYIAPMDFTIGEEPVKKGSWIITVKVHDDRLWQDVKSGKLTGFSIGGIATIIDS